MEARRTDRESPQRYERISSEGLNDMRFIVETVMKIDRNVSIPYIVPSDRYNYHISFLTYISHVIYCNQPHGR